MIHDAFAKFFNSFSSGSGDISSYTCLNIMHMHNVSDGAALVAAQLVITLECCQDSPSRDEQFEKKNRESRTTS